MLQNITVLREYSISFIFLMMLVLSLAPQVLAQVRAHLFAIFATFLSRGKNFRRISRTFALRVVYSMSQVLLSVLSAIGLQKILIR
jgi:hypothetical protein